MLGCVRRWEVRDKSYQISVIVGDSTQGFINKGFMLLSHPHPVINQICPYDIRRPLFSLFINVTAKNTI